MDVSFILPILVSAVGLYLLIRLRGFFLLHPIRISKTVIREMKDKSRRKALSLALAGTLGVGNIFGISAGIIIGGAGTVFWLLVSAVFSVVIKYAEALLSAESRLDRHGGMHRVIDRLFSGVGAPFSFLYASLCLFLAFFMGAAMQSAAVLDIVSFATGTAPVFPAIFFAVFVVIGVINGVDKIEKITEIVIPMTTVIYILLSLSVIFLNFAKIPSVLSSVVCDAFEPCAIGGGAFSFVFSKALGEGYARGILSNEAGIGTSSMSHSRADGGCPSVSGLFGMCEVFFDTLLLCPLTAVVILVSVSDPSSYTSPMLLLCDALSHSLGGWASFALLLLTTAFAYSTVICWYYYGRECADYLSSSIGKIYPFVFFFFVLVGGFIKNSLLLLVTDLLILFMSLITMSVIFANAEKIVERSRRDGIIK